MSESDKAKAADQPPDLEMQRRELRREDGRYLLYYEFIEKREEEPCRN